MADGVLPYLGCRCESVILLCRNHNLADVEHIRLQAVGAALDQICLQCLVPKGGESCWRRGVCLDTESAKGVCEGPGLSLGYGYAHKGLMRGCILYLAGKIILPLCLQTEKQEPHYYKETDNSHSHY